MEKKGTDFLALEKYLVPDGKLSLKIAESFGDMTKPQIVFLLLENTAYPAAIFEIFQLFAASFEIIYLAINTSASDILAELQKKGIDAKNASFIDTVATSTGREKTEKQNISYVSSPEDLTEIDFRASTSLKSAAGGKKLFLLDSVSDMLVYNETQKCERFLHSLATKIRGNNATGIFIMLNSASSENEIKIISHFCDKTVHL